VSDGPPDCSVDTWPPGLGQRDQAGHGLQQEEHAMTRNPITRWLSSRRQLARLVMFLMVLVTMPALPVATAQKLGGQLNYLGWEGYDDPDAFKPMTDQGVVFNRTYIGNNDELIAKFRAGGAGAYDVGNINSRYLGAMVKQNMLIPLDESRLAHHKSLFRAFKDFGRMDGKLYTVPVFFGFTTLCYRTDMVPKPTWDFYKDPQFAGKYGVAPNPLGNMFLWAMVLGKGMDARKWTQDDLKQIKARGLAEFRNAKTFVGTPGEQKDLLIRGDVVLTTDCYDAVAAGAVAQGAKVASVIPPGPRKIWVDMYFIFRGAKNLDAGYAYLNTALSPQAQATMAKKMELSVSNQDAYKQLPADLAKKLGYEQANELIAGSEFNILPDPDAKPPHVSIRDLYTAFDEIRAAVKK
jgi:spermidine/putrescine transport system substrate-binding protein